MNDTNDYYLYQGKIYHCSECTTEAEMYGADTSYGYGKTLLFLDGLGNYVDANDCLQVAPNFWQHLRFWICQNVCSKLADVRDKFQDLRRPKCVDVPFEDWEF